MPLISEAIKAKTFYAQTQPPLHFSMPWLAHWHQEPPPAPSCPSCSSFTCPARSSAPVPVPRPPPRCSGCWRLPASSPSSEPARPSSPCPPPPSIWSSPPCLPFPSGPFPFQNQSSILKRRGSFERSLSLVSSWVGLMSYLLLQQPQTLALGFYFLWFFLTPLHPFPVQGVIKFIFLLKSLIGRIKRIFINWFCFGCDLSISYWSSSIFSGCFSSSSSSSSCSSSWGSSLRMEDAWNT